MKMSQHNLRYLLDVNILISLVDTEHFHHLRASEWFHNIGSKFWATCPITENGFSRVISNKAYINFDCTAAQGIAYLAKLRTFGNHKFISDNISVCDIRYFTYEYITHPNHITDAYLVALAKSNNAKLATLDKRIKSAAVKDSTNFIEYI